MKTKLTLPVLLVLHPAVCFSLLAQTSVSSGHILTIAGSGTYGFSGDGGPATNAALAGPMAPVVGPTGRLYFFDDGNGALRLVNPTNGVINTIVSLSGVQDVVADRARNRLYIANLGEAKVSQVNLANHALSPFAGVGFGYPYDPASDYRGDGGPASGAWFSIGPWAVATDGAGNVFISEGSRIRRVNIATTIINTICGLPDPPLADLMGHTGDGGPAANATLFVPIALAADHAGNLFILDADQTTNSLVRRIDAATGIIDTIAGGGTNAPGTGPARGMYLPAALCLAVDDAGTRLFIGNASQVFLVDLTTGILSIHAGTSVAGFNGDGHPALSTQFETVRGLAVAPGGGLIIADRDNRRVRYLAPDSITLTNDPAQLEFHLPWVSSLNGSLIITNNPNLTVVDAGSVTNVNGSVVVNVATTNSAGGTLDLGALAGVGGTLAINVGGSSTNTGSVDLGSLTTVVGDVAITVGGSGTNNGTVDLGSLTSVVGDVAINVGGSGSVGMGSVTNIEGNVGINVGASSTNTGTVDLGSLTSVVGDVAINVGGSGSVGMGSVTDIGGSVAINVGGSSTNTGSVDLGSLTNVCGDLSITGNATNLVTDLNRLTNFGCGTNPITMTADGTVLVTNGLTIETNATLAGSATVDGAVTNNGTISPGSSPGHLNFARTLVLKPSSRLRLELGGYAASQFDSLSVAGALTLGGTLSVSLINDFPAAMTNGASFTLIIAGSPLTGAFANVASGGTLTTTEGYARFTVTYAGANTVQMFNLVIVDTDGDGLADWWEDRFGLNKNSAADAALDTDGDGASNLAEFLAGTDPTNAASVFRIITDRQADNVVRLSWPGPANAVLETSTNLAPNSWSTVPGATQQPDGSWRLDVPRQDPQRFYRVKVQ